MNLTIIKTIYRKELLDTLRDKRTLGVMILLPVLLYPLLMIGGGQLMTQQAEKMKEKVSRIALADHDSPALRTVLDADEKIKVVDAADARKSLGEGDMDAAVAAPPDCDRALAEGRAVKVTVLYDGAREESMTARSRVVEALHDFEEAILEQRLAQSGLDPSFANPLETDTENVASAERMGGFIMGLLLPFVITMMALLGAFYPAIDLTAGEKERGTLETLLTTPVGRLEVVVGKFLTVCTIAFATVLLNFGSLALTVTHGLALSGLREELHITLPFRVLLATGLLMLPTTVFFSATMMAIAVFARSFKEAQNYLSPLYTVAMLPAAVVFIPGVKLTYGLALAPVAGPALFIKQFAVGTLDWGLGSVVLLATCFYAALALWGAAALFAREDVVLAETDLLNWRYLRASLRQGRRDRPAAGEVLVLFAVVLLLIYYVGSWLQHRSLGMGLILTQLLLVLNPALLFLAVLRYDLRATLRLRWPGGRRLLAAVCAAVGGALLTAEIAVLQNLILPLPEGFKSQAEELMKQVEGYGLPAALLVGAVLVGCCEETLFRGVILAGMLRSWRPAAAITLTAMLFGICHLSPYRLLTTTLLGLLLGYLAWRSGSLWCSIAAHASVNGLALGLAFSPLAQQPWVQEMAHLPPALLAAGLLLCVGGVAALHSLSPPPDAEIRAVNG